MWCLMITGNSLRSYFSGQLVDQSFSRVLIIELGYDMVAALSFYLSCLMVAPVLIIKRHYATGLLLALVSYVLVVCSRYALEFFFLEPILHFDNYKGRIPEISYYLNNIFYFYFPTYFLYGLLYFFAIRWYENNKRQQELHQEQLGAELAFLRAQVNPHFLFNTINDIYSLSYQSSPLAPEALLKLSSILRYMLREGNNELVPLNKEVEYLENVIDLQRISAKDLANITFIKEGYIGEQRIVSLLFIAFVENAFKHGTLDDENNPVVIFLRADNSSVELKVSNAKSASLKDTTPGIGLKNVLRRLELIYPGRHEITINDKNNLYVAELLIKLDK